jgi:hypothetical protein
LVDNFIKTVMKDSIGSLSIRRVKYRVPVGLGKEEIEFVDILRAEISFIYRSRRLVGLEEVFDEKYR